MWDKIKDQAKTFQQSQGSTRGASGSGQGSHGPRRGRQAGLVLRRFQGPADRDVQVPARLGQERAEERRLPRRQHGHVCAGRRRGRPGGTGRAARVEELIVSNEVLQNFPADQLRQRFNQHVDRLLANFEQGKAEALQVIAKAAKKPAEARAVVQTGMVVAGADGTSSRPSSTRSARRAPR